MISPPPVGGRRQSRNAVLTRMIETRAAGGASAPAASSARIRHASLTELPVTETAIRLSGITKSYNGYVAVRDLSLEVPRGSVFGLLGPNGAGKTTTLRMVMNILAPDSGAIEILGAPAAQTARDRVGYMPEEKGLYPRMVLGEQLIYLARLKGVSNTEATRRLPAWLERMGLEDWAKKKTNELSKGMQQKAQLIAALLHEPEIVILDEPMSGLDPIGADLVRDLLLDLSRQGRTLIVSSHQMETVERLCDRVALISQGVKILAGEVAAIKHGFGRNNVVLAYEGDGSFLAGLPGVTSLRDFGRYVEIALAEGTDATPLLREAAARLKVSRFEIVEPSLHEIFVDAVERHTAQAAPAAGGAA